MHLRTFQMLLWKSKKKKRFNKDFVGFLENRIKMTREKLNLTNQ